MDYYWDKGRQTLSNVFSSPPPVPPTVQYHGLLNQGATCYLNSVLQVLFKTEDFREAVERHCFENPATKCIDQQLKDLFDDLKGNTAYTYNITKKLGIDRVYEQQDAAEYYEKILSLTSPDASQIFHGWLTDRTTCSACGTETDTDGAFWHLPLALVDSYSEHYSVVDGIKEHFRASESSGENQMYCEECDAKCDATTQCVMKHHPEVLMLLLKRFDFDYRYMTYVKINQTVDVPRILQIPENQTYELYAVVDHSGVLRSGHYSATIWDDENWFTFNDSRVTLADYQPFQEANFEKSRSAYLLFYRKKNATQTPRAVSAPGRRDGTLKLTQREESVDNQDSGKESTQDVGDDLKPEISDMIAKDAHLRKEVERSNEEMGVMDVKTGEDKQSEKEGKSLTNYPEDNAKENVDENLWSTQEVGQDNVLKPVSEDEQRDEREVRTDDKQGKTEAGERGITSEIGRLNRDLLSSEIHEYGRDGSRKQNMPKDDHQHGEERMDAQKVEEQRKGDDKHAQRTDTSVLFTQQCVMKHHPEVLMLLLKRFDFDYRYKIYVKINQTVDVPRILQIPEADDQPFREDNFEKEVSGGFLTANNDDCQDAAKMRKREEVGGPAEVGNDIVMTASINRNEDTGIRVIDVQCVAEKTLSLTSPEIAKSSAQETIIEHKVELIDCLSTDHSYILQHAHAKHIITHRQYRNIKEKSPSTPEETVIDLIDDVTLKNGPESWTAFLEVLKRPDVLSTYPPLEGIVIKMLRSNSGSSA